MVTVADIQNYLRNELIKEMFTHFLKRQNVLLFTKNIEDVWNSLSGYEAPAGSAFGRRRNLESLIFDLPPGTKARIWWDLPKFTDSVYFHAYLESPRYTRIKLVNTDTGDYYEVENYFPAAATDNRIYKYVNGTLSANINLVGGMDTKGGMLYILSWDSRSFTDTLWCHATQYIYSGYGGFWARPWVMRDKDITEINRIEIEWYNDGTTSTLYGEIGIIGAPIYAPILITYR